jgi:hypothetical protein
MKKLDLINELVDKYGYEEKEVNSLTNAKLSALIKQEEEDVVAITKEEKKKALRSQEIERNELIEVMSNTTGGLILGSPRTGSVWKFTEYGQTDYIEFHELETFRNVSGKVFTDAILIILDERVVKKFRLEEIYESIVTPVSIESLFNKSLEEVETFLEKAPDGMLQAFTGKAVELYRANKLNNVRLIKFIEEKFNIDFEDMV